MSKILFTITRLLSCILVISSTIQGAKINIGYREVFLWIGFLLFLLVSKLYEKKKEIFGVSYIIYFITIFWSQFIGPYSYIYNDSMINSQVNRIPNDNFNIYFVIFLLISLSFIIYLNFSRKIRLENIDYTISIGSKEIENVMIMGLLILIPLNFLYNIEIVWKLLSVFCSYFFISFYFIKEIRKKFLYRIGLVLSFIIICTKMKTRFILVQYLVPFGIAFLIMNTIKNKNMLIKKYKFKYVLNSIGIIYLISLYGVSSEIIKLNLLKGNKVFEGVLQVIFTPTLFMEWLDRQSYRIFGVWTVLGGNMIDYINQNGYFYGLSYIKSFAPIIGLPYVSLPKIIADMIGASYAQPGLVAEGYANFGIIGAVINVMSIIVIAEYLQKRFLIKKSCWNLLLISVPFVSVIIDGGTLNSIIFNIIICYFTFGISKIPLFRKKIRYI